MSASDGSPPADHVGPLAATAVSIQRRVGDRPAVGEWVEVRSKAEILATLDARGQLDNLPFMPEMFEYCGRRLRVFKSAHKTCDTVNRTGGRSLDSTFHLEDVRCSGAAHGGCEAACLIFWKQEWLRPIGGVDDHALDAGTAAPSIAGYSEAQVIEATIVQGRESNDPTYACQATLLPTYTRLLQWWDLRQYVNDWRSRNERLRSIAGGAVYVLAFNIIRRATRPWIRLGPTFVRAYNAFQRVVGGVEYPRHWGSIAPGERTPAPDPPLDLQPGELVRVKSYSDILKTLDGNNRNRGMYFDAEEVPYCGGTYRVRSQVNQIIDERTGKMIELKGNPVILDNVWCMGHYSDRRMFCPRAIYSFWREAWLERVDERVS